MDGRAGCDISLAERQHHRLDRSIVGWGSNNKMIVPDGVLRALYSSRLPRFGLYAVADAADVGGGVGVDDAEHCYIFAPMMPTSSGHADGPHL